MSASASEPIRVLHFADVVNRHDFIDVIVRHADPTRFEMSVATLGVESNIADPEYEMAGVPFWNLHASRRKDYPTAVVKLARLVRRGRIDIVHANHYEPGLIATAASAFSPRAALVMGRHYSDAIYLNTTGLKRGAMLALEAACNRRARCVVAPSTMIERLLRRQGVPSNKIAVIPYAFEDEKFAVTDADVEGVRAELSLERRLTLGTFARLYRDKGHRYLLDAMASIVETNPDVLLLLVGDGAERANLEWQVERLGISNYVRFLGWRRDALVIMAAVDVVVQPTLQEAFSQTMVEALWLGKPLVMADVSGARDVIDHGKNGLVVPPGDSPSLAAAVGALCARTSERMRLGAAGRATVQSLLSVPAVLPAFEQLYVDVIGRQHDALYESGGRT
jgi:glycosyltransferase involved in cell wall biosynthesis